MMIVFCGILFCFMELQNAFNLMLAGLFAFSSNQAVMPYFLCDFCVKAVCTYYRDHTEKKIESLVLLTPGGKRNLMWPELFI